MTERQKDWLLVSVSVVLGAALAFVLGIIIAASWNPW